MVIRFPVLNKCQVLTATHINYYLVCTHQLRLFSNGIQMEHNSEIVADGKLLHVTSYPKCNGNHMELTVEASCKGNCKCCSYYKWVLCGGVEKLFHEKIIPDLLFSW
ncbi:MAG: Dna2/Cas4 domain-containing protein [Chitinophagaceae bacterium]|nr:Dna2/Cas4 domain-containing protein [Chitinophagaceae bacterium]